MSKDVILTRKASPLSTLPFLLPPSPTFPPNSNQHPRTSPHEAYINNHRPPEPSHPSLAFPLIQAPAECKGAQETFAVWLVHDLPTGGEVRYQFLMSNLLVLFQERKTLLFTVCLAVCRAMEKGVWCSFWWWMADGWESCHWYMYVDVKVRFHSTKLTDDVSLFLPARITTGN